ncbi:MAG: hypothetical protein HOH82_21965, partial [Planctomycetaceae bacterium]|nr:hypothetical protein [Planctomycetaceae bacterium]
QAAQSITGASAPFSGTFRPGGILAALNGEDPNGIWQLEITDAFLLDQGTLNSWSLTILTDQPSPGEPFTVTDANGDYTFTNVVPGIRTVQEVLPPGFVQTFPRTGAIELFRADFGTADQTPILLSADVPLAIQDQGTTFSQLNVSGLSDAISDVNLTLDISHTFVNDLDVFLISPTGTRVQLVSGVGTDGQNFTNTTFDDEAAQSINAGIVPFTGTFRPDEFLATFDGEDPNGIWRLEIEDTAQFDTGTLNSWSLQFVTGGGLNNGGFTSTGFNDQWHVTTERGNDAGHSAGGSYYFGDEFAFFGPAYTNNADGTLTSPIIDLTPFRNEQIFLDFNHFLAIEDFFDAASVSIFAGGVSTVIADNNSIGGLPDFTSGFDAVTLDLSQFTGQQIQVQFGFDSDSSVTFEGWYVDDVVVRTGPLSGVHRFEIQAGDTITGIDFGNQEAGEIRGTKFNDLDGDGVRDAGEPGIEGVIVFLDDNNNGVFDSATELYAITDADGNYAITDVPPGSRLVRESAFVGFQGESDPALVITELDPDTPDFLEIQNVTGTTIDTTGWQVFVSGDAAAASVDPDINAINTAPFDLQDSFAPGEISFTTDSTDNNFFGSNIFWINGRTGWAMIVDGDGQIVDWVGWGWTEEQIDEFSVDTGGAQNVTLDGFWSGPGAVSGGIGTLQRTGSTDNDGAADFGYAPESQGGQNTGLDLDADFVQTFPASPADRVFIVPRDSSNQIAEIDAVTGAELNRFFAPEPTSSSPGLAFDGSSLFFMELDVAGTDHELFELDPNTGAVIDNDPVAAIGGRFDGLAALNGLIYLSDLDNDDILVFDPISDTVIDTLDIDGLNPSVDLAGGISGIHNPDRILAFDNFGENVIEIDPATGVVTASFAAAPVYTGLTVVNGELFLGDFFGTPGIDVFSRDGRLLRRISLPFGIGAAGGDDGEGFAAQVVTVVSGQVVSGIDFGNQIPTGEIRGTKFNDINQNGRLDPTEGPLGNVTIFLDTNGNGLLDDGERSTSTNANGEYQFTGLEADTYFVTEVQIPGFQQTYPQNDPRLVITEVDLNTPDFFEIQNVSTAAIDTSGWRVFVSDNSADINVINPTFFNLPDSVAADEVIFSTDDTVNPFGANILWINTEEAWVMIVDDAGQIVDWVGWGWTEQEIESFDVNLGDAGNVTLAGEWIGPAAPATGPNGATLQRLGPVDSNSARDFAFAPITRGSQNSNLTTPFIDRPTVNTVVLGVGQIAEDIDFGNVDPVTATVQGTKFSDLNGNGVRDSGEPGLAGFTIFADTNSNGQLDRGEIFTVTDADGNYILDNVPTGIVTIAEVQQDGFEQTAPGSTATPLVEFDFESGTEGFTFDGEWNLSNGRGQDAGHSSSTSFYFGSGENADGGGTYANDSEGSLVSGEITLPDNERAFLEFNHLLEIENFFDTASVAIISGGVTTVISDNNSEGILLPDDTGRFQPVSIDISQFAGTDIQIEFRFETDFSVTFEGWYVDDVAVRTGVPGGVRQFGLAVGEVVSGIDFGNRDLDEFGNSIAEAASVNLIANQTARINSRIDRAGDVDVFQFVAPQTGFLAIRLETNDSSVDPFLRLFDNAGTLLATDDDGGSFLDSFLAVPITQGERFFLEASSINGIGAYELELISTQIQSAINLSLIGPNQFLGTADGEIVSPGQVRVFDLTIPNGAPNNSELVIDLARATNSSLDTILLLIDPQSGEVLEFNDDFNGLDSQISRFVNPGEQFFVVATGFGDSVGEFNLVAETIPPVVDDFSDDVTNPFNLGFVDVVQNGVIDTAGDVDTFLIEIPVGSGGLLTIDLQRDVDAGSNLDTVLTLLSEDGQDIIAVSDDTFFPTFSLNSQIERQVVGGDRFVLAVRGFSTSQGAYTLSAQLIESADVVANSIQTTVTSIDLAPLFELPPRSSVTQAGTIDGAGDLDVFRVAIPQTFPANRPLRIRQNAVGSNLDPLLRVFDANGNQIAFNDDVGFDPGTFQFSFNSSTSVNVDPGITIFVQAGAFGSSSGDYELLFDVEDDFSDNVGDAVQIPLDTNGAGSRAGIIQTIGDVDVFQVTATIDGLLTFELTGAPGDSGPPAPLENPFLTIIQEFRDGEFREVAVNDDFNGSPNSQISIVAQTGDVFFVQASAFGFGRASDNQANLGNYLLNVTTPAATDDLGDTFADATLVFDPNAVNLGLPVDSFEIDPGDTDSIRFVASTTANVTFFLDVPLESTLDARLSAFERVPDPTNSNPTAPTDFIFERIASDFERELPFRAITFAVTAGEEYVIQVSGNADTSGAYGLSAFTIDDNTADLSTAITDGIGQAVLAQVRQRLLSLDLANTDSDVIAQQLVEQAVRTFISIFGLDPTTSFLVLVADPVDLTLSDSTDRQTGFVAGQGQANETDNGFFSGDGVVELLIIPTDDLRFNFDVFTVGADFRFDARLVTPGGPSGGLVPRITQTTNGESQPFFGRTGSVLQGNLELVLNFEPIPITITEPPPPPTDPPQPPVLALSNGLAGANGGLIARLTDSTSELAFSPEAVAEFARLIRSFNQLDVESESSPEFLTTDQLIELLSRLLEIGAAEFESTFGVSMEELDLDMIIKLLSEAVEEGSVSALKMRQQLFDWAWSRFDADIIDRLWNPNEQPQDNNPDADQNDDGSASLWKQRLYDEIAAITAESEDVPAADKAKSARFTPAKVLKPVPVSADPKQITDAVSRAAKNAATLAD